MPRLYGLFQPIANYAGTDDYGGLDPNFVGNWNAALAGAYPGFPNAVNFDESWKTYRVAPYFSYAFGILSNGRTVSRSYGGVPNVCNLRTCAEAPAAVLAGFVDAFANRMAPLERACGYKPIIYFGMPPQDADVSALTQYLRVPYLAGFRRFGIDVGAAVKRDDASAAVGLAFNDLMLSLGVRPLQEGGPTREAAYAGFSGWVDRRWDLIATRATALLVHGDPTTYIQANEVAALGSEYLVIIDGSAGTPTQRYDEALLWRSRGWSVILELSGIPAAKIHELRRVFGP